MKNNRLLDKFTEIIANALLGVSEEPGWHLWPMPHFHPSEGNFYLYAPKNSFLIQLRFLINALRDKGLNDQDIALLFKKPSRIATLTFLFEGLRYTELTKEDRIKLAVDILNFITCLRKKDPFCEEMRNILWEDHEVKDVLGNVNLISLHQLPEDKSTKIRKLSSQINASLWLLCEYLYFNHHFIGHEFHGPYKLSDGSLLVVREYYDLKNELWSFSNKLPANQITSFEVYEKGTEIKFDFFNRIRSSASLPPRLLKVRFKKGGIEGEELDENGMKDLLACIIDVCNDAFKLISGLKREQLLEKYVETKYYILKPLAEKLGLGWRPSKEIYDFIRNIQPPTAIKESFKKLETLPRKKQIEICRLVFDPRIDELPRLDEEGY